MPRHKGVGRKVKRKRANESEVVGAEPDGAVEGDKSGVGSGDADEEEEEVDVARL